MTVEQAGDEVSGGPFLGLGGSLQTLGDVGRELDRQRNLVAGSLLSHGSRPLENTKMRQQTRRHALGRQYNHRPNDVTSYPNMTNTFRGPLAPSYYLDYLDFSGGDSQRNEFRSAILATNGRTRGRSWRRLGSRRLRGRPCRKRPRRLDGRRSLRARCACRPESEASRLA